MRLPRCPRTVEGVNIQPYIVQQRIEARHADLVRQADAARLAAASQRRRRLSVARLRVLAIRRPRLSLQGKLEPEA
jgi:hypothetical protein